MFTGKKFWMRTESVLNELWEILWMIWSSVSQSLKLGWIYSHHRAFDYKALPVCVCACAHACMCVKSCLTFCNPSDYSLLGSLSMEFFMQGYWWGLAFPSQVEATDKVWAGWRKKFARKHSIPEMLDSFWDLVSLI